MYAAALSANMGVATRGAPKAVAFMVISKEQVGQFFPKGRFKRRYRRYISRSVIYFRSARGALVGVYERDLIQFQILARKTCSKIL
jgi:hypothetical protein